MKLNQGGDKSSSQRPGHDPSDLDPRHYAGTPKP